MRRQLSIPSLIVPFLCLSLVCCVVSTPHAQGVAPDLTPEGDTYWADGFAQPGIWGEHNEVWRVYAVAVYQGDLYVGGRFDRAGGVAAKNIARWDGTSWHPVVNNINGEVKVLTVYQGELIAGGSFTIIDGMMVGCVARWNGSSWGGLLQGMNGPVLAFTVHEDALIIGGRFARAGGMSAVGNIASWDGAAWHRVGAGVALRVRALTVYGGDLIAAGERWAGHGTIVTNVTRFDGSDWLELGGGVTGNVFALAAGGGKLFAGGAITAVGGVTANRLASWDGAEWQPVPSGLNSTVWALASYRESVIVGGEFTAAGGAPGDRIASWDGNQWQPLSAGLWGNPTDLNGSDRVGVLDLVVHDDALLATGVFSMAGDVVVNRVARWDGARWGSVGKGNGLSDRALALAAHDGSLVCGGFFRGAGASYVGGVARWDGATWSALGEGIEDAGACNGCRPYVSALGDYDHDLIAGGNFHRIGGRDANFIARWNGDAWHPLGDGLGGVDEIAARTRMPVAALTVGGDDLFAAGTFASAAGVTCNNVARWDGASWHPLGDGVNGSVHDALWVGDALVLGGEFTEAGGAGARHLARWDESGWRSLGDELDGHVFALAVHEGDLIVGGAFTGAGGTALNRIARWDGTGWQAMGSGADLPVRELSVMGDVLCAGGPFSQMNGVVDTRGVAKWDGTSWMPLGTGTNAQARAFASLGNSLFVAGDFITAGDKFSSYVAQWEDVTPIEGSAWVVPRTFVRKSNNAGPWVWAHIRLPGDYDVRDIDLGSVVFNDNVAADPHWSQVTRGWGRDRIHKNSLIVRFPRAHAVGSFSGTGQVEAKVSGTVAGEPFEALDHVSIIPNGPRLSDGSGQPPLRFTLGQNHPNPFNPSTRIRYQLPNREPVTLGIFDVQGRLIKKLVDTVEGPGSFEVEWDGRDTRGAPVASGIYFYRLSAGTRVDIKKMTILK